MATGSVTDLGSSSVQLRRRALSALSRLVTISLGLFDIMQIDPTDGGPPIEIVSDFKVQAGFMIHTYAQSTGATGIRSSTANRVGSSILVSMRASRSSRCISVRSDETRSRCGSDA